MNAPGATEVSPRDRCRAPRRGVATARRRRLSTTRAGCASSRLEGDVSLAPPRRGRAVPVLARKLPDRDEGSRVDPVRPGSCSSSRVAPSIDRWPRRARLGAADRAPRDEAVRRAGARLMAGSRRTGPPAAPARGGPGRSTPAHPSLRRPPAAGAAAAERIGVRKTYKLYIGGQFPRSESGRAYVVLGARGQLLANAGRGRARTSATRCGQRAALPGWAGEDRLQPRPGPVPDGRADGGTPRPVRGRGRGSRGARAAAGDPRGGRRPSTDGCGTPAGRTSSARSSGTVNPVAGSYFNFSVPEPTGVVGVVAPEDRSLLGLVSRLAPVDRQRQHGGRPGLRGAATAGRHADRGPRHQRRAGRRHQPHHRPAPRSWCRGWPRTWTSTRSTPSACPRPCVRLSSARPSRT